MGTNYYFRNKFAYEQYEEKLRKINLAIEFINENVTENKSVHIKVADLLEEEFYEKYKETELHIGKKSFGWKPLLQINYPHYTNMKELHEFYKQNEDNLDIVDEYDEELTFEELSEILLYKGGDDEKGEVGSDGYRWTSEWFR